ncbi:unnamed protein product [Cylindrotheca closterium]|uniref:RING-type E3 ubiquitin transferase n=1 Tax=Cylindrotheca closterium TaxID=2856 RepID=A0AAD2GCL7_9STRA|nr:unnamed protein product [Cylindrotheca closterium]
MIMSSNQAESIVIDSDDDCKPAAVPSPRRKKRRHQSSSKEIQGSLPKNKPSATGFGAGDDSDDSLVAYFKGDDKDLISKRAAAKITQEHPQNASTSTIAVARKTRKKPSPTALDSDDDSDIGLVAYLKGEEKEPKALATIKEKVIEIDSDNDCKPAALPGTYPGRKRHRSGVDDDDGDDSKRQQINQDVIVVDTRIITSTKSANNQDIIVMLDSDSGDDEECWVLPPSQQRNRTQALPSSSAKRKSSDFQLATILQQQEYEANSRKNKADAKKEHEAMTKSPYGKAILVVQKILELTKKTKDQYPNFAQNVDSVSTDDMVFLAKNLLETQASFLATGSSSVFVDVGYHYTNSINLDSIRTNGLMTKNERDSQGVKANRFNGSAYGDGVYTGNNPIQFSNYGDTGLIVGRLLGTMQLFGHTSDGVNTVLVPNYKMVVLKTSAQCLPVIKYNKTLATSEQGKQVIQALHTSLQQILDQVFNRGLTAPPMSFDTGAAANNGNRGTMTVPPPASLPIHPSLRNAQKNSSSSSNAPFGGIPPITQPFGAAVGRAFGMGSASTTIPGFATTHGFGGNRGRINQQNGTMPQAVLRYIAPERLSGAVNPTEAFCLPPPSCDFQSDCAICQDALSDPRSCVALKVCSHVFHKDCIEQACKFGSKCPTCRKCLGTPSGKSPSGSMSINVPPITDNLKCSGFATWDTIVIVYSMQAGTQKHYHENPGQPHPGKHETAYLPNNAGGRNLLKRLKFAFLHGLTFTIGTSMTTGATNQCTWSSIHHKTSPNRGVHGFPDPNYFANCNGELDSANVPATNLLDVNGQKLVTTQH